MGSSDSNWSYAGEWDHSGGFISGAAVWGGIRNSETEVSGNSVYITGGTVNGGSIFGANVLNGDNASPSVLTIARNTVTLESATIEHDPNRANKRTYIGGGWQTWPSDEGEVVFTGNELNITNSNVHTSGLFAAHAYTVPNRTGTISGTDNRIAIEGSTLNISPGGSGFGITATDAWNADASNNTIQITESTINWDASSYNGVFTSVIGSGGGNNITANGIELTDVSMTVTRGQAAGSLTIYGAQSVGNSSGNWLRVLGQSTLSGVTGLSGVWTNGDGSAATGNTVEIRGNNEQEQVHIQNKVAIYGGRVQPSTSSTVHTGSAHNNTVTIQYAVLGDASVPASSNILGGYLYADTAGTAEGNQVAISHSTINNAVVVGGYSRSGSATNNTVTIGPAVVSANQQQLVLGGLFGGRTSTSAASVENEYANAFEGNTLNLSSVISTASLKGFQNYNFYVSQSDINSGRALITVTDESASVLLVQADAPEQGTRVSINGTGLDLAQPGEIILVSSAAGFIDETGIQWTGWL